MSSRNLKDAVSELQEKIPLIIADYEALFPDRSLIITCTLRSTTEQQMLFAKGRTIPPIGKKYWVTQIDGINTFSAHNPDPIEPKAKAVDMGVLQYGKYITDNHYYEPLLDLSRKYHLVSGWSFEDTGKDIKEILKDKKFHDSPHIQTQAKLYIPPKIG